MSNVLEYKGYLGSAEVDVESGHLHGKLLFIRDTITYSALAIEKLADAFHEAVEDYLSSCEEVGDAPDVPLKGSFNVRVGPDLHRRVAMCARRADIGLNDFVCDALEVAVHAGPPLTVIHRFAESRMALTGADQTQWTVLTSGNMASESSYDHSKH